ncbi:MAG: type II toxin-antitoxin system VapC family toxin [Chthoniobacterales bacterium]
MVIYWDASPIIALLAGEPAAASYRRFQNERIVTWWGTSLECISAIARRHLEGADAAIVAESYRRLHAMRDGWQEVHASESLHRTAVRLLKTHPLRAGDALQLGAALIASGFEPHSARFLTQDVRLKEAAEREGFVID